MLNSRRKKEMREMKKWGVRKWNNLKITCFTYVNSLFICDTLCCYVAKGTTVVNLYCMSFRSYFITSHIFLNLHENYIRKGKCWIKHNLHTFHARQTYLNNNNIHSHSRTRYTADYSILYIHMYVCQLVLMRLRN